MSGHLVGLVAFGLIASGCTSGASRPSEGSPADGAFSVAPVDAALGTDTAWPDARAAERPADVLSAALDTAPSTDGQLTIDAGSGGFPSTVIGNNSPVQRFTVANRGTQSTGSLLITIDGANGREFLATLSTCIAQLGPGRMCSIGIVFRPLTPGMKSARLTVSSSPGGTAVATLSAVAQGGLQLTPTSHDFPTTAVPEPGDTFPIMLPVAAFTITNSGTGAGPLATSLDGADAANFGIAANTCAGVTLPASGSCTISLRFKPTSVGDKAANLNIAGPGIKLSAPVVGTAKMQAKLLVAPTPQTFGVVSVGMKHIFSFDVINQGGSDSGKLTFGIEGVNMSEFSAEPDPSCNSPLKPGASCAVAVTFAPTTVGKKTASLRAAAGPGGSAIAEITAEGLSPYGSLSLAPTSPDPFGTVTLGQSSVGSFVLTNGGSSAADRIEVWAGGSRDGEFIVSENKCPELVPAGTSCMIAVKFAPALLGRRTGNLGVIAHYSGEILTTPLSGVGRAP
jgi:hypothetical protein